jgi:uncharacterized protein (DUF1501 family)
MQFGVSYGILGWFFGIHPPMKQLKRLSRTGKEMVMLGVSGDWFLRGFLGFWV